MLPIHLKHVAFVNTKIKNRHLQVAMFRCIMFVGRPKDIWLWLSKPFWDPILVGRVNSPPMLEPILVHGWIGMFTAITI